MLPRFEDIEPETFALIGPLLPLSCADFVRLIGLKNTLALVSAYGGTEIAFPKRSAGPGAAHFAELAEIIGADAVRRLADEFACQELVYVPRCLRAMNALRNHQIIIDYSALIASISGRKAANQLAKRYRTTSRSIEKIVNGEYRKKTMHGGQQ